LRKFPEHAQPNALAASILWHFQYKSTPHEKRKRLKTVNP